jgi:mono/diheme cytochrome c family protein
MSAHRASRVTVGLLAAFLVLVLAACSDSGGGAASGEEVFRKSCASCHGTDGQGGLGPDLGGVSERLTREEHVTIVKEGKGQMPTFGSQLSDSEIDAVVDYERGIGGPAPPPPGGGRGDAPGGVPVPGGGDSSTTAPGDSSTTADPDSTTSADVSASPS